MYRILNVPLNVMTVAQGYSAGPQPAAKGQKGPLSLLPVTGGRSACCQNPAKQIFLGG